MKFKAKIKCTIDKDHPDIKYVKDWTEDKVLEFSDEYSFSSDYTKDGCVAYIKRDLKLVAGGGYSTDHIHNVEFEIERVD